MGSGSLTEMGSGFCSEQQGDGGLGSGSRVRLVSSSVMSMVSGDSRHQHPLDEGGEALSMTIEKLRGQTTALVWWHLV